MNAISSGGSNGVKGRNKSSKDIKMFNREESTDGSRNKKDNKDSLLGRLLIGMKSILNLKNPLFRRI